MTIENPDAFWDSLPDWAMLKGCFGMTTIAPSDIDGWVERNGISLFLEHKKPSASIKNGQLRGYRSLVAQGNTVIIYWGQDSKIERLLVMRPGAIAESYAGGLGDLRREVSSWFAAQETAA